MGWRKLCSTHFIQSLPARNQVVDKWKDLLQYSGGHSMGHQSCHAFQSKHEVPNWGFRSGYASHMWPNPCVSGLAS